ncbi:hypothetical protein MMEU_5404 [Mycobacterium marinum str. Europe]|nr:hypothetical protein MMEU_5404 [Mycobacterium marinum str. Europe]
MQSQETPGPKEIHPTQIEYQPSTARYLPQRAPDHSADVGRVDVAACADDDHL